MNRVMHQPKCLSHVKYIPKMHEEVLTCGLHEGYCITPHDALAHHNETQECITISIPKVGHSS